MTQRTLTDNTYAQRIMRRVTPALALIIGVIGLFAIFNTALGDASELRTTHETGLLRTQNAINAELEHFVEDVSGFASSDGAAVLLDDPTADPRVAMQAAADLIRAHPGEYQAVRVIARSGRLQGAVENNSGTPNTLDALLLGEQTPFASSQAFGSLMNSETALATVDRIRLLREGGQVVEPITPVLDMYVPVIIDNVVRGAVHAEIIADDIFSLVEAADGALIPDVPERRVLLVGNNERILADSGAIDDSYQRNIMLMANQSGGNFYGEVSTFVRNSRTSGEALMLQTEQPYLYSTIPLSNNGIENLGWQIIVVDSWLVAYSGTLLSIAGIVVLTIGGAMLATYGLQTLLTDQLAGVATADTLLERIVNDERQTVTTPPTLTGDKLVTSVDVVANRLETLSAEVEKQVRRRNRDLQVAGRIGRETATRQDLDTLANRAINLIANELGFYHAQIFLLDDAGINAVLRYSRGDAGAALLEQGHQLRVGSDTVIGTVTSERRPVIVNDTQGDEGSDAHGFNPLLPDTRAEMGLPLVIGDEVIGALDLQSRQPNAFLEEDIPTYQLLADQIAVAIYNAQLRQQTQQRMEQVDQLNRQLTRDSWSETEQRLNLDEHYGARNVDGNLQAPLSIRGEVIGDLAVDLPEGQDFSEGDRAILQAVAERVSLAIENARLFQETQTSLAETSTLYRLSQQLNEADTLDEVLEAIITTVAPDAAGGQVWLFSDYLTGERPDWVTIAVDLAISPRGENAVNWEERQFQLSQHAFFDYLAPNEIMLVDDIRAVRDLDAMLSELFQSINALSIVFIPLVMRGGWKGFLSIEFTDARRFSDRQERIFNALIGQAGVAIDNRLLLQQTEEALTRQEKLYSASRIINTTQNPADLVHAAVATTSDPDLDFWIGLLEGTPPEGDMWPTQSRVIAKSDQGMVEETDDVHPIFIPDNSPMRNREPEVLVEPGRDLEDVPRPIQWLRSMGYEFMAIFPMFSDNKPIALFYIVADKPYELSLDDYDVYRALTGQMSTQIQNARLLERTEDTLREIRRLYVATRAISSAQDVSGIYDAVAGHLALPFIQQSAQQNAEMSISVLLAQPKPVLDAPELEYVYQWSSDLEHTPPTAVGTRVSHDAVPLGDIIHENDDSIVMYNTLDAADLPTDDLYEVLAGDIATAAAVAPLWSRQRWFGVLIVRTNFPSLLTDTYGRFIQAIADQIAIAIENQSLLRETEFERERLQTILSTLPTGVLVLNPETFIPQQANERVEELLGRDIDYTQPFTPDTYNMLRSGTQNHYPLEEMPIYAAQRQNMPVLGDDVVVMDGNKRTDLLVSAAPIYDENGDQEAIIASFQDITTLRSMENTMQENLRETVLLYETQRTLAESDTLDDLLDNLLMQLAMQQPSDAYIILTDKEDEISERLYLARSLMQPIDDVYALKPLLQTTSIIVNDVLRDNTLREESRDTLHNIGARSALILPMRSKTRERPLGWMLIVDTEPEAFTDDQERTMTSVADMASTAVDNSYLVESTQAALDETAALYNAATTISRSRDLVNLFDAVENALRSMNPDMYAALLLDDAGVQYQLYENMTLPDDAPFTLEDLIMMPIPEGGVYATDLTRSTLGEFEIAMAHIKGIQAFAAIDLRVNDIRGGRLFVAYTDAHRFDEGDRRFLGAIADSTSVVIDNQLLLEQVQSTLQEQSVLYQASKGLLEVSEPHEIVNVAVNYVIDPMITQVFIALLGRDDWDSSGATVEIASSWQSEIDMNLEGVKLTPEQFPAWTQLSTPSVLTIEDVNDPDLEIGDLERTSIQSLDTRSLAIIPLRVPNRNIGAIWIGSREPIRYTDTDLRIFQAFGEQTSLTLEAQRLLEETEARAGQLQTSAAISQSVTQILDLNVLLPQVVDLIQKQFGYDQVQIFLMDDNNQWAELRASTGEAGEQLLSINHKLERGSQSVIGEVTKKGEPSIALDTADADVVHKPNPYLPRTRSEMALPLLVKGEVVGALDVQSNTPNAFHAEDIQALEALASQIAVAIDNARLYEDVESSAQDLSFLFETTTGAASAETLEDALTIIAGSIYDAIQSKVVAIYLPRDYQDSMGNTQTLLEPAAISSTDDLPVATLSDVHVGAEDNLIGTAAETLQTTIIRAVADEPTYQPTLDNTQSALVIPINTGGDLIGVVTLENDRIGTYDEDTVQLLRALAGSVAAIIQNTLLLERLQVSNEQLRELDRLRSQFLASMSHELRTPLNSIIGFSRVMLKGIDGPLTDMQEQDLQTIYTSGNHLLNLINDILDQAKIEANELNLKFDYFEIKPMVESVKSIAIGMMKDKPLSLDVEVASGLPKAYGDEFRTRQILLNVVSNAIKFTQDGSVTVQAYAVAGDDGDPVIRIDVTDTGIGIAEDDMDILFEQFRQVDSSLTRTVGGTGLGLPISKSLTELQGGAMMVESEINVGSTFSFTIPTTEGAEEKLEERKREKQKEAEEQRRAGLDIDADKSASQSGLIRKEDVERAKQMQQDATNGKNTSGEKPKKRPNITQNIPMMNNKRDVVLVEESKDMVDQFRRILQKEGFEVTTAEHPSYAEAMVGQLRPSVVLLDVNFAEGKGWDILKSLKERDDTFDIPIIVTTMSDDSERAYRLGAHTFIERPFLPDDLLEAVLKAEKESQRERILIIDDQPEAIRLLEQLLNEHGDFRVFSAESGDEGISLVARRHPDLIILDLRMPDKDGFAVLDELRDNPETAKIPVLVVTGDIDLNATELDQLQNIDVLPKTDISQEEYDTFIQNVRAYLEANQ